jgi:rhamnopyranosyl-N-acetylglucosaminyl-diphospho-decaprenol beta-1,3/1,4-galactofuranosyltransferase
MRVFALIVTYNRLDCLKACLDRLARQKSPVERIVIVDNNSTDGTAEFLKTVSDKYTVINPGKNLGGAGGIPYRVEMVRDEWRRLDMVPGRRHAGPC